MVAFGGLFAALSRQSSAAAPRPGDEPCAQRGSRAPRVQRQSEDKPSNQYSRGRLHGALVSLGRAKKCVEQAASLREFASGEKQGVARIAFSQCARGRHSANARCVCCVCIWYELLVYF